MPVKFHGVITPMITPFKEDLSMDVEVVRWLVRYQVEGGVHGIFPNSTTGEFVHLSRDESVLLVKIVLEEAHGWVKVIPGISSNSTAHSLELGKVFRDFGVDGVIVTPPFFFKPTYEGLKKHFSTIAEKLDIPVIVYNIPSTTGINIPIQMYLELASEYSNIVGAKVTFDSFTYLRNLIIDLKSVRSDFSIFTGLDDMFLPALMMGGDGGIMALANATPKLHREIYDGWREGDFQKAYNAWKTLLRIVKVYDYTSSFPSAVKILMKLMGSPVKPYVRPPLTMEKGEVEDKIRKMIMDLHLTRFIALE
jgi:4-hydroxy-tetrahydrodipicolinate synthase